MKSVAYLVLACLLTWSEAATAQLGTVTNVKTIACKGKLSGGVCQQMTVSCPGVNDLTAFVKTNSPSSTAVGTVTFITGTGGTTLYENQFTYGRTAIQNVLNAGYTTVQITFGGPFISTQPNGWLQGPGGVVKAVACRYATVTQWISTNINQVGKPLCATGNSGGASAIGYALSDYGLGNTLSMVEPTGGPTMSRVDYGCLCNQPKVTTGCYSGHLGFCYGITDATTIIDPAYSQPYCSESVAGNPPPNAQSLFQNDSIDAPAASYNFSRTFVNMVLGTADTSPGPAQGETWLHQITSGHAEVCVSGAGHAVPNSLAGADQISSDIISLCK
jgi:hypothetical protein